MNHVVENGDRGPREERGGDGSGHQRYRKSLEDRIGEDDAGADDHRGRGEQHGTETHCAGVNHRFGERHSLPQPQLNEIDQNDGVANDDSRAGDEADHGRCGKECAQQRSAPAECPPA